MEVFLYVIIVIGVIWALVSGIIAISRAWRVSIAKGDASGFMSDVFSGIGGNWIAVLGIILLCFPVWLVLSIVVSGKKKNVSPAEPVPFDQRLTMRDERATIQENAPTIFAQSKRITIGRNPDCDISVDEKQGSVSRNHAVLFIEDGALVIEDDSTNGTYVNGQKLHCARRGIKPGDQIRIGFNYILSWNDINSYFPGLGDLGGNHAGRKTERR